MNWGEIYVNGRKWKYIWLNFTCLVRYDDNDWTLVLRVLDSQLGVLIDFGDFGKIPEIGFL